MMIEQICGKRIILKKKYLLNELQQVCSQNVATAIDRYEMMGMCQISAYMNK